jgi:hypothetical protein
MTNNPKFSLLAIAIGIATSLILFTLLPPHPYILAVGPLRSIIIGRPSSIKYGAIYSLLILGFPITLYLFLSNPIPIEIYKNTLLELLEVIFLFCFWGVYGAVIIYIKDSFERGKPWCF